MNRLTPYLYVGNIFRISATQVANEELVPVGAVVNGAAHTLAPDPLTNLQSIHIHIALARCGHGTEASTYT
jgi:hypothetical protein